MENAMEKLLKYERLIKQITAQFLYHKIDEKTFERQFTKIGHKIILYRRKLGDYENESPSPTNDPIIDALYNFTTEQQMDELKIQLEKYL
jgi:hypothetical protein